MRSLRIPGSGDGKALQAIVDGSCDEVKNFYLMSSIYQFSKIIITIAITIAMAVPPLALWACSSHLSKQKERMKNNKWIIK